MNKKGQDINRVLVRADHGILLAFPVRSREATILAVSSDSDTGNSISEVTPRYQHAMARYWVAT